MQMAIMVPIMLLLKPIHRRVVTHHQEAEAAGGGAKIFY
jgi:hypothetical protein